MNTKRVFLLGMLAFTAFGARAETGVTDREILIGQFAAFSGPAGQLGARMRVGIEAHFKSVNAQGGVNGRQLKLVTRDDGYEPEKSKAAVKALIEEDKVFALIGSVGTPTGLAAVPVLTAANVPLVGMFTGAQGLREPFNRNVFHVRASYFDEAERIVQHLTTLGVKKIAVFYQDDAYGKTVLDGVNRALARRQLKTVATGTVERNSTDVAKGLDAILPAHPDAIVQVSAYKSCAAFIKQARAKGFGGQFFNVSFVGAKALADELGDAGTGVVISQVVPFPYGASSAVVREYQQRMKEAGQKELDFSSLEGFLTAKVFTEGLKRAGRNLTRDSLIAGLETMHDVNLGGFLINYSPTNHMASNFTDLTIVGRGGKFVHSQAAAAPPAGAVCSGCGGGSAAALKSEGAFARLVTPAPSTPDKAADGWPFWSILIVDDERGMRNFLVKTLVPRCHFVMEAGSAEEGAELLSGHHVDLIILDISLPGKSGVAWLKELRDQGFSGEVILITAFADLDTAIEALRAGASDFILKPFRVPQILNAVKHCYERSRLARENYILRRSLPADVAQRGGLVGCSRVMQQLTESMRRVAGVNSTVLLQGESGTGKELVARALHELSARAQGPFVPVNCASMSPELIESELFGHAKGAFTGAGKARDGLFYYAQGGTLFLDEVAELPLALQATLLRALEDLKIRPVGSQQLVPVNVRIVAATNRSLAGEVAAGRFRKDLYYRLQVVELTLPPLREHKEDIPALVAHFMAQLAPSLGVDPLAISEAEMAYLMQYEWPGNVRELRNLIERSLILGTLNVSALYVQPARASGQSKDATTDLHVLEKQHILSVLDSVQGDKTRAAQLLGISRRTLERRVAEWGVPAPESR